MWYLTFLGNHEDNDMNRHFSFYYEVIGKYREKTYQLFQQLFQALPLACVLNHKVLVLHGGVGFPSDSTLSDLEKIEKQMHVPMEGVLRDVLWSDPKPSDGIEYNEARRCSHLFGPYVTEKFLQDNGLELLIRSHQVKTEGYSVSSLHQIMQDFITMMEHLLD